MEKDIKVISGSSKVWSLGIGYDPAGVINLDFIRWYIIIVWNN